MSLITNFLEILGDAHSGEKSPMLNGQSKCPYVCFEGDRREKQGGGIKILVLRHAKTTRHKE